jgi:DNA-binding ferritin-like protein (Dps family)
MVDRAEQQVIVEITSENAPYRDVEYSTEAYIGRGELGAIYRGTAVSRDGLEHPVAVKVPHNQEKSREVLTEFNILEALGAALGDPVQPAGRVALGNVNGLPVMIMPLYSNDDLLVRKVRSRITPDNLLATEKLAVESAVHFARVMAALHRLPVPRSCTDRKIKDFYRQPDGENIIIDWNVLRDDTEEFRVGEIRLFGYLWHELFLERKGDPPFEPFYDLRWRSANAPANNRGVMSVGLRVLLARAIEFSGGGGSYFESLEQALRVWRDLLESTSPSAEGVRRFLRLFPADAVPSEEEVNAVYHDLRWRITGEEVELRDEVLKTARQKTGEGDALSLEVIEQVERDPRTAAEFIKERLREAEANGKWVNRAHLQRWVYLVEIINRAQADSGLSSRDQQDIERRMLLVGKTLHTAPVNDSLSDLEEARSALRDVLNIHRDLETPELQMVFSEIALRTDANAFNRAEGFAALNEKLKDITVQLESYPRHYLKGTDADNSLLAHILHYNLLKDLRASIEALIENPGETGEIYNTYRLLLAAADIRDDGRWMERIVRPWLDLVAFIELYAESRIALDVHLRDLLAHRQRLMRQKAVLDEAFENWQKRVSDITNRHVREALKQIEIATGMARGQSRLVSWGNIQRVTVLVEALKSAPDYYEFLTKPASESSRKVLERYHQFYDFFHEWFQIITEFAARPSIQIFKKITVLLEEAETEGIDMADLLGGKLLREHQDALEQALNSELEHSIDQFENRAAELSERLGSASENVKRQMQNLQRNLGDYNLNALQTLQQQVRDELDKFRAQQQELEVRRALNNFDLPALRALSYPGAAEDIKALEALENDELLRNQLNILYGNFPDLPGSYERQTIPRLREMRKMLRQGDLPGGGNVQIERDFFTHANVVRLAEDNHLLQGLLDLYWAVRINRLQNLTRTEDGQLSLEAAIASLTSQAQKTKDDLLELNKLFEGGRLEDAEAVMNGLENQPALLTNVLLKQIIYGWRERIAACKYTQQCINTLHHRLREDEQAEPRQYLDKLLVRLEQHLDILRACPHGAYTETLHDQWTKTLSELEERFNRLSGSEYMSKVKDRKRWQTEIAQCMGWINSHLNTAKSEAENKLQEHHRIFGVTQ